MAGNILNFNGKKIKTKLSDNGFYDFYLSSDSDGDLQPCTPNPNNIYGKHDSDCLVVHFDFNDEDIYSSGNTIYSLATWSESISEGYEFDTIGLTGIDNGLINFSKSDNDVDNDSLFSSITNSTLVIPKNENRFFMNPVSGMSGDYIYPTNLDYGSLPNSGDTYMNFCGGFYQGFYKIDGSDYEVLPTRVHKGWVADFWLNKSDDVCSGDTGTTLNEVYPENKGIFFYMGTRAENKFWNQFNGLNTGSTTGCTTGDTTWCTPVKEMDISLVDDESGFPISLNPPQTIITEITNEFLIYGRARGDENACGDEPSGLGDKKAGSFTGDSVFITSTKKKKTDFRNPFLIYGRARGDRNACGDEPSGLGNQRAGCYSGDSVEVTELDWVADVVDNAIGFIIKDDGSIGYRLLTVSGVCSGDTYVSGCSIEEKFSASGIVKDDEWTHISIRFVANELDDCELEYKDQRKGKLMFYINCKLKFVVDNFDEFIARRLDDHWKKQVGVPFNFSLGGGSQGLVDSMTFDGQDPSDKELCIESNFSGSFIGSISQFRFNICDLDWCELKNICSEECGRYGTCSGC